MDFGKPLKKDGKPDGDGHYGWESPGLRHRVEEAKTAKVKAKVTENYRDSLWSNSADTGMLNRDKGKP